MNGLLPRRDASSNDPWSRDGTAAVSENMAKPLLSLWHFPGAWPGVGAVGFKALLPWRSHCCLGSQLSFVGT